jgi:hypothetical protein
MMAAPALGVDRAGRLGRLDNGRIAAICIPAGEPAAINVPQQACVKFVNDR